MEERFPERIDSKFRYILVAANRAEQIMRGSRARIDGPGKPTRLAMEEISRDLVNWDYGPAPVEEVPEAGAEAASEEVEEVH